MWKTFCSVLTAYTSTHAIENQILQAACSTFITFNAWLDESNYETALSQAKAHVVSQKGNTYGKRISTGNS